MVHTIGTGGDNDQGQHTFVPKKDVDVIVGKTGLWLYEKLQRGVVIAERSYAFQLNNHTIDALS